LGRGIPKNVRRDDIEQREYDAGDERTEEKIPEENDFVAFHYQWLSPGAMILFERSQVNHKAIPGIIGGSVGQLTKEAKLDVGQLG